MSKIVKELLEEFSEENLHDAATIVERLDVILTKVVSKTTKKLIFEQIKSDDWVGKLL